MNRYKFISGEKPKPIKVKKQKRHIKVGDRVRTKTKRGARAFKGTVVRVTFETKKDRLNFIPWKVWIDWDGSMLIGGPYDANEFKINHE